MKPKTMLELLLKTAFYLGAGLVLAGASIWYLRSLYAAVTGKGEIVIVPFAVVGGDDDKDKTRGTALARMLQAQLQEIESDLATSQRELMGEENASVRRTAALEQDQAKARTAVLPVLFVEKGATLQTKLLEPTHINVTVAGVEVGGLVPWLQRLLINRRSLEFSFYEGETKVSVAGSLQVLGMRGEGLRVELPKTNNAKVNWDDVTAEVAYEVIRRRLALDSSNRVEVLSRSEFRSLVEVMREVARLNRAASLGRPVRGGYGDQLQRIEPLVRSVPEWYQLNALAASIAESADDKVKALDFYQKVHAALTKDLANADKRGRPALANAIERTKGKITELEGSAQHVAALTERSALEQIRNDVRKAAEAYNTIFGVQLGPPPVKLLPPEERNAYFDGETLNAPPSAAKIPDLVQHDVTWQYLENYVPIFNNGTSGLEENAVLYSYSDILPMLLKQKGLIGGSPNHDWTLYAGAVAWIKGGDEEAIAADRRPLRSFVEPGNAYDDKEIGKDPQIAHIKELSTTTIPQSACGIGNKAFYEAARVLGIDRAWTIWLEALKQVAKERPVTFRKWGTSLLAAAGADREKVMAALKTVGLGTPETQTKPRPANKP